MQTKGTDLLKEADAYGSQLASRLLGQPESYFKRPAMVTPTRYGIANQLIESNFSGLEDFGLTEANAVSNLRKVDINQPDTTLWGIAAQSDGKYIAITPEENKRFGNLKAAARWFVSKEPQIAGKIGVRDMMKGAGKDDEMQEAGVKDLRKVDMGTKETVLFGIAAQKDGKFIAMTPEENKRFGNKKAAIRWFISKNPSLASRMGMRDKLKEESKKKINEDRVPFDGKLQKDFAYIWEFMMYYRVKNPAKSGALHPGEVEKNMPKYPLSRFDKEFIQSVGQQLNMSDNPSLSPKQVSMIEKIATRVQKYTGAMDQVMKKFG